MGSRELLLRILHRAGLHGSYDFVYLPFDFRRKACCGYSFVNFVSHADAERAMEQLDGFDSWEADSYKCMVAKWAFAQGLETHVKRFRRSKVMHHSVNEEYKPVFFKNGAR